MSPPRGRTVPTGVANTGVNKGLELSLGLTLPTHRQGTPAPPPPQRAGDTMTAEEPPGLNLNEDQHPPRTSPGSPNAALLASLTAKGHNQHRATWSLPSRHHRAHDSGPPPRRAYHGWQPHPPNKRRTASVKPATPTTARGTPSETLSEPSARRRATSATHERHPITSTCRSEALEGEHGTERHPEAGCTLALASTRAGPVHPTSVQGEPQGPSYTRSIWAPCRQIRAEELGPQQPERIGRAHV